MPLYRKFPKVAGRDLATTAIFMLLASVVATGVVWLSLDLGQTTSNIFPESSSFTMRTIVLLVFVGTLSSLVMSLHPIIKKRHWFMRLTSEEEDAWFWIEFGRTKRYCEARQWGREYIIRHCNLFRPFSGKRIQETRSK